MIIKRGERFESFSPKIQEFQNMTPRKMLFWFAVFDAFTGIDLPFEIFLQRKMPDEIASSLNTIFNQSERFIVVERNALTTRRNNVT